MDIIADISIFYYSIVTNISKYKMSYIVNNKEDIIDLFISKMNTNSKVNTISLYTVNNNPVITECSLFILNHSYLLDIKKIYIKEESYISFLTFRKNSNFLRFHKENKEYSEILFDNHYVDSEMYVFELHFIKKGSEISIEDIYSNENYSNNNEISDDCLYNHLEPKEISYKNENLRKTIISVSSYEASKSEKSYINFTNSSYKKVYLPLNYTYIHHARPDRIISIYKDYLQGNKPLFYDIYKGLYIEITINKRVDDVSKLNDYPKFRIFMFPKEGDLTSFFGLFKFSISFSKESISNYISKYIVNLLCLYTNLSPQLIDYLRTVSIFVGEEEKNEKKPNLVFPLSSRMTKMMNLINNNKKSNLYKNLNTNNRLDSFSSSFKISNFIKLKNYYYNQSFIRLNKIENKEKDDDNFFFNEQFYKNYALNKETFLIDSFDLFINQTTDNNDKNKDSIIDYFISSLSRHIVKHITYSGFTYIDVISNEDGMAESIEGCGSQSIKTGSSSYFLNIIEKVIDKGLGFINKIFNLNEGFFHKHLSILGNSYNFNHSNTVITHPIENDCSMKNKIRVFDVLFKENWANTVSNIAFQIWKIKKYIPSHISNNSIVYSLTSINDLLIKGVSSIIDEYFTYYNNSLPDFLSFSLKISDFVKERYNMIDNVCQHFANKSLDVLLKKNLTDYTLLYTKYNQTVTNQILPLFDSILEPYFIHCDSNYISFANYWANKQDYVNLELKKFEEKKKKKEKKDENLNFLESKTEIYCNDMLNVSSSIEKKKNKKDKQKEMEITRRVDNYNIDLYTDSIRLNKNQENINEVDLTMQTQISKNNEISEALIIKEEPQIKENLNDKSIKEEANIEDNDDIENDTNERYFHITKHEIEMMSSLLKEACRSKCHISYIKNGEICVSQVFNEAKEECRCYSLYYIFNLSNFFLYKLDKKLMSDMFTLKVINEKLKNHKIHDDDLFFLNGIKDLSSSKELYEKNLFNINNVSLLFKTMTENMCLNYYDYACNVRMYCIQAIKNESESVFDLKNENLDAEEKFSLFDDDCFVRIGWLTCNLKK